MNEQVIKDLQETEAELLKTLSSFTDEQIDKIPFKGSWTAGQVAEHLLKSDMTPLLYGKTEKTNRESDKEVKQLEVIFLDFETKMKNPDFNTPTDESHNKKELIDSFTKMFKKANEAASTLDLSKTSCDFELPNMGKLTLLEWLYFMIYHTQRHTHQLKNILDKVNNS